MWGNGGRVEGGSFMLRRTAAASVAGPDRPLSLVPVTYDHVTPLVQETSAKVIHVQQAAKAAARAAADAEAAAAAVAAAMAGASGSAGTSAPTTDNTAAAGAPAAARAGGAVIGSGGILMVPATALSQDPQVRTHTTMLWVSARGIRL